MKIINNIIMFFGILLTVGVILTCGCSQEVSSTGGITPPTKTILTETILMEDIITSYEEVTNYW